MNRRWSLGGLMLGGILLAAGFVWQQKNPMEKPSLEINVGGAVPCRDRSIEASTINSRRASIRSASGGVCASHIEEMPVIVVSDGAELSVSDIHGALKDVVSIADPIQQSDAVEALVSSIPVAEMSIWANAFQDSSLVGSISEFLERLVRRWARENPSAAATWAEQQPDPAVRHEALNQVALAWSESDVTQALEWALQLPADEAQADVLKNLGYELARTDPVKALALAATLSSERGRDDLLIHAASQWANTDALAATEWACAIPGLALRERVLAAITTAVADQNPESAVLLTTQTIWPGKSQNQAAIAIVQRWSQQDPQGAASWVQQFPAGELKDIATDALMVPST